jgi:hypothetical protein
VSPVVYDRAALEGGVCFAAGYRFLDYDDGPLSFRHMSRSTELHSHPGFSKMISSQSIVFSNLHSGRGARGALQPG